MTLFSVVLLQNDVATDNEVRFTGKQDRLLRSNDYFADEQFPTKYCY